MRKIKSQREKPIDAKLIKMDKSNINKSYRQFSTSQSVKLIAFDKEVAGFPLILYRCCKWGIAPLQLIKKPL
jgi:hypothetical protein